MTNSNWVASHCATLLMRLVRSLLTTASCCCCSEDRGPTRNLLTSQFLTPTELRQILRHCYGRCDRQGLMLAAMLALGVYNGFRSAAPLALHT